MSKKSNIIILSVVCAGAFLFGIWAGYIKTKNEAGEKMPTENVKEVIVEEETLPVKEERRLVSYKIVGGGGEVGVYEVFSDRTENEIDKIFVDTDILPSEERKILEEGIEFTEKEDMLMALESITS